jgi:hypothetical protein
VFDREEVHVERLPELPKESEGAQEGEMRSMSSVLY